MMITGTISKTGSRWAAIVELLGCFAGGKTKAEAYEVLTEMIQDAAARSGKPDPKLAVHITDDGSSLFVSLDDPGRLTAALLRHQREARGLSMADVATRLGARSKTSYAVYEQGRSEPTISKLVELLAVVAPNLTLTIGPGGMRATSAPTNPKALGAARALLRRAEIAERKRA